MASRLDRLFVLLETGSTPSTRKAAAQQLGQVQRSHPHELPLLLQRVHKCLRSQSWETRIAAGLAVEAILGQVPAWPESQIPGIKKEESDDDVKPSLPSSTAASASGSSSSNFLNQNKKELLTFDNFDINKLLTDASSFLMASEAKIFDKETTGNEQMDQATQRDMINKRLGLDIAEKIGIDTSDIISQEDLESQVGGIKKEQEEEEQQQQQNMIVDEDPFISEPVVEKGGGGSLSKKNSIVLESDSNNSNKSQKRKKLSFDRSFSSNSVFDDEEPLSSREINLAKRRARKLKSREILESQSSVDESGKKLKREDSIECCSNSSSLGDFTMHFNALVEDGQWPLSGWVDLLTNDLFNPQWEIRHGAATALREVIRLHGNSGGKTISKETKSQEAHDKWLEDLALRIISVLALDRFGDFVSDQVVAPVRETCSQCLGTVLTLMSSSSVKSLLNILILLLEQKPWEVRHGSLLALKYLFAVRRDLMTDLLPLAFPSVFQCLSDHVDDVCAVASSALIPVADILVSNLPLEAPRVVNVLWDSMADLDDLSSACNSIMGLLATLLAFPAARSNLRGLDALMPRLWPFLHHTSSSVRKSALMTLQKLTELDPTVAPMSVGPLQETLRHTYQRALVEHIPDVLHLIPKVWTDLIKSSRLDILLLAACPVFGTWLCLAMQPPRVAIDPAFLVGTKHMEERKKSQALGEGTTKLYMSGSGDGDSLKVAETRLILTRMLGKLTTYIVKPLDSITNGESPMDCFVRIVLVYLNSRSALQKTVVSLVLSSWPAPEESVKLYSSSSSSCNGNSTNNSSKVQILNSPDGSFNVLSNRLVECLNQVLYFDEIAVGFTRLQSEGRDFVATLKYYKVPLPKELDISPNSLFSFDQVQLLCSENIQNAITQNVKKSKVLDTLLDRRKSIWNLYSNTTSEYASLNTMMLSSLAGAVVNLNCLPEKLNPVVKPLMESLRKEENALFQKASAQHLCHLMGLVLQRNPCPIPKIIQNLTSFLCSDENFTLDEIDGILSLSQLNSPTENTGSPGKKMSKVEEVADLEAKKVLRIQRRGATVALTSIVEYFGTEVPIKVAKLWEVTFEALGALEAPPEDNQTEHLRKVIDALQVLEIISPHFHVDLFQKVEAQIGRTCVLLGHKVRAVRHMASRCLAVWASIMPEKVLPTVAKEVIPRLDVDNHIMRQGAIESIWCIVDRLGLDLLPMIVLLVVPVLGRMSDQDESVRSLASLTFATLVRLLPLEGCVPDPPDLPDDLAIQKGEQRKFLQQLMNPNSIPEYKISVPINAELRPYQQAGINWLGFLNKYKLHGILCDDMGLGKTLQSICILGSDHYNRMEKHKIDKSPDSAQLPSIVICPPTLTGHWVYEVEKFIDKEYLNPLHYHGPPVERNKLKPKLSNHNLVVVSYDIVRNDIDFFSSIHWNYCILDEGHIIKNGKTKISKAIKELKALHRLLLTGTPIQNNVLELWSLFDFLMPGFLGSEKQFSAKFARPILMARDPKSSPKDQEAGALAMEALHRQALPFLLRRLKEDVLKDLPPKITQDYYCDLSPIQEQLYDDFARSRAHQSLKDTFSVHTEDSSKHSHIFQALQYLRKVCNHPKLVLTPQHPKFSSVMNHLSSTKSSLNDIQHSAKLPALKQLLLDCGIGVNESSNSMLEGIEVVSQHRALIFCQLKVMLDILENDLLKIHLPTVTYLRLDGGIPAGQRHSLVTRFNNDPSIDVLLLTTQVGGLGLNLTGADTVIFVEHDWNPMRDLQAMDRAHRIGQKKVVNVYRLITRGTLEEKIMGLQKFKLMTANTVISQENSCIETMQTDQILDLFVLEDNKDETKHQRKEDVVGVVGAYKNVLENIPELWEDDLYNEEYDLSNFIRNLNK